jgi:hypothetical protein
MGTSVDEGKGVVLSISDAPQELTMEGLHPYSVVNDGASAVYFIPSDGNMAAFVGDDAALLALGANKLQSEERISLTTRSVYLVCATGESSTLRLVLGVGLDSLAQNAPVQELAALNRPESETPSAALTAGAANARLAVPTNARAVDLCVTGDDAYVNFVTADEAPAQVGRRLLVNSQVRLVVPSGATHLDYKRVTGDATINLTWLIHA